jgi:predicted transcriptional regulator of viral defense system
MASVNQLSEMLSSVATPQTSVFTLADLRSLLPEQSDLTFKTMLSRAVSAKHLARVCRGLYLYEKAKPDRSRILYHAAAKLRPLSLNYLSLETVLSDAGVISQMPVARIMVMSSARASVVDCGVWGSIEFVRTWQNPADLAGQLTFDAQCHMWRASVPQALRDMRATHRSLDLVDWSVAHEFV